MYRDRWTADVLGDRSVLSCALDVHMTSTGAMERSDDEQERDVIALRNVEADWKNPGICLFDDCVLSLVRAAIKEAGYATRSEMEDDDDEYVDRCDHLVNLSQLDLAKELDAAAGIVNDMLSRDRTVEMGLVLRFIRDIFIVLSAKEHKAL